MQAPEYLSAADVADMAGVAVSTVTYWARLGYLPVAFKHSGRTGPRYFHRSDVEAFLAQRDGRPATPETPTTLSCEVAS